MPKRKILYVCHNHPDLFPGGAETYALELHEAMRSSPDFESIFLARVGSTSSRKFLPHRGTPFSLLREGGDEYLFHNETANFDSFYLTSRFKDLFTTHFREFLLAHRPDVVHFQHTLHLGYDLIREVRNTLGDVPIVYTLHEYLPICHRNGQMVRTLDYELCSESSPRRCHECFPDISPQTFFMRKLFISSHLSSVDLFVAPSEFLLERYVDWGIPREKIIQDDYGRKAARPIEDGDEERARTSLGFFGQLNPYKGVTVLLEAMKIVGEDGRSAGRPDGAGDARAAHLWIHGANLDRAPESFQREFGQLLDEAQANVTFAGEYNSADLPAVMANVDWVVVPSIWWENSPLVIQEAFLYGRPVICSDIGGMAEKVTNGVNGLHFRVGDPVSLAETIERAVTSPELWRRLRAGIPPVHSMEEHVATLSQAYGTLLERMPSRVYSHAH